MADDTRLAEACLLLNYSSQSYSNFVNNVNKEEDINDHQYLETTTTNREPIHNLLAAVNCALPSIRNKRPTILQRSATRPYSHNINTSLSTNNNLPDHDYCQQDNNNSIDKSILSSNNSLETANSPDNLEISSGHLSVHSVNMQHQPYDLKSARITPSKRKQMHSKASSSSVSCNTFNTTTTTIRKRPLKLVAVHLGAGNSHNETESMQLAKSICEEIMLQTPSSSCCFNSYPSKMSKRRKVCTNSNDDNNDPKSLNDSLDNKQIMTAEQAVVQLIKRMEDNSSLNCGYGSNLNIRGQVECDASLMCDKTQMWAGVGAVSGCRNPILLAKCLYDSRATPRPLGLIQPNLLVGSGAKQWMREYCPHLSVMDSKLVSSKALSTYQKLKSKYDNIVRLSNQNLPNIAKPKLSQVKDNLHRKTNNNNICIDNKQSNSFTTTDTNTAFVDSVDNNANVIKIKQELIDDSMSDSANLIENFETNNQNNNRIAATSLDHGFYCIKTGVNLKKVPSFARTISKVKKGYDDKLAIENFGDTIKSTNDYLNDTNNDYMNEIQVDFQYLQETEQEHFSLDTVGAIAVDCDNNFASAISSGGLLLKYKGRVGQAAIPGAGCWSEDCVAVTTTGVGEYLTLNTFAKKFYDKMLILRLLYDLGRLEKKSDSSSLISCAMSECFEDLMKSRALDHVAPEDRLAGMLSVSTLNSKDSPCRVDEKDLYLSYAHNTKSMCIGYMTCNDIAGHSIMSRKGEKQDSIISSQANDVDSLHQQPTTLVRTLKFSLDPNKNVDS